MRPPLPRRPGTPRQFRLLLIAFVVRHIISLALFSFLTYMSWRTGSSFVYVMVVISIAFLGFAWFEGTKIWGQYQRSSRRAAAIAEQGGK